MHDKFVVPEMVHLAVLCADEQVGTAVSIQISHPRRGVMDAQPDPLAVLRQSERFRPRKGRLRVRADVLQEERT